MENIEQNNALIAQFMGWEYFPKSKHSVEYWGSHNHFVDRPVWVLNPTELYRQCPIHCGYEYNIETGAYDDEIRREDLFENYEFSLNYHSSWDLLMSVVERIEKLGYWVESRLTYVSIGKQRDETIIFNISFSSLTTTKIEAIYNAVVKFINWYNKNKS